MIRQISRKIVTSLIKPIQTMPLRRITINWKLRDGSIKKTDGNVGENLMRLAHRYDIELEGELFHYL